MSYVFGFITKSLVTLILCASLVYPHSQVKVLQSFQSREQTGQSDSTILGNLIGFEIYDDLERKLENIDTNRNISLICFDRFDALDNLSKDRAFHMIYVDEVFRKNEDYLFHIIESIANPLASNQPTQFLFVTNNVCQSSLKAFKDRVHNLVQVLTYNSVQVKFATLETRGNNEELVKSIASYLEDFSATGKTKKSNFLSIGKFRSHSISHQVLTRKKINSDILPMIRQILSGLSEELEGRVAPLLPSLDSRGNALNWNSTKTDIEESVRDSIAVWQSTHSSRLMSLQEVGGEKVVNEMAHKVCQKKLAEVFKCFAISYKNNLLLALERTITKLSSSALSRADLQQLASSIKSRYKELLKTIKSDLEKILDKAFVPEQRLKLEVDTSYHYLVLSTDMNDLVEIYVKQLTMTGALNPYLRRHSFPPLHINLNYMFRPEMPSVGSDLYDDRSQGISERRADGLRFDGIAFYPFDFNEAPLSTEPQESWIDLLKAFFTV